MDGEAGWWTTRGNIGLPPLARAMGVGRQQQGNLKYLKFFYAEGMTHGRNYCQNQECELHTDLTIAQVDIDVYKVFIWFI